MNRLAIILLFLSLTAFCSTGCRKEAETAANSPETTTPHGREPEAVAARGPEAPLPSPDELEADKGDERLAAISTDVKALAEGNNQFAFDLYARLAKQDGNIIFSPYSISSALVMTYAGARGTTADEMAKTLHLDLKSEQLHPAFADLSQRLIRPSKRRGSQLLVANVLWVQKGYPIQDQFLQLTRDDYQAGVCEVDFKANAEGARQDINRWVEKQTRDTIRELLKPNVLTKESRLVLVNAIYFRSLWAHPFAPEQTKEEPFQTGGGKSVRVPMMYLDRDFLYFEDERLQILELPYQNKRLSMIVILPRRVDGLADVEKKLTATVVQNWLSKLTANEVTVKLPKFATTCEFQLGNELGAMGMPLAFKREADFTGISGEGVSREERLHISEVVHQARMEVSEEGAKAMAATAVVETVFQTSGGLPPPPKTFQADHPFLFLIQDRDTRSILFLGRTANPSS